MMPCDVSRVKRYAEAVSKGDANTARRVLENLNPLSRQALAPLNANDAVVEQLAAAALRSRGYLVDINVGQSKFRRGVRGWHLESGQFYTGPSRGYNGLQSVKANQNTRVIA